MIAYYIVTFFASLFCFLWYLWKWDKRCDIHFTYVMLLITISELGALQRGIAHTLEGALIGNAISYIGGCFLQLSMTGCILHLCRIHIPKWIMVALAAVSATLYAIIFFDPWLNFFYLSTELDKWRGITIIHKQYGPGHTFFYALILFYCLLNTIIFIYGLRKKRTASVKNIVLLFLAELSTVFVYFFQKLFPDALQLTAVSYVLSQVMIVIIMNRVSLYDVDGIVMDAQVEAGDFGCFLISLKRTFLGSNAVAEEWFQELKQLRVDFGYGSHESHFLSRIDAWISELEETDERKEYDYMVGERHCRITVGYFLLGNKKKGYTFSIRDNTKDMELVRLMDDYNTKLEEEVAQKTQNIREMQQRLVLGMADMVESRDGSTGGHIKRTSKLVSILINSAALRNQFELEDRFCKAVIKAAPMHDLGKIAVDDAILRKQGRFTSEEYSMMKTHAEKGAGIVRRLLKDMGDDYFAGIAENVAHFHHERIDGTGYPMGLKGEEIPFEARIMAIADVYDALVSKRCYKERMSFAEADKIILEGMGSQFDLKLKEAYLEAKPRFEAFYADEFAQEQ